MGEKLREGIRRSIEGLPDIRPQLFPSEAVPVPSVLTSQEAPTWDQQQVNLLRNFKGLPLLEEAREELSAKYADVALIVPTDATDIQTPINIVLLWGAHYENGKTTWNEVVGIPRPDTDLNLVYVLLVSGTNGDRRYLHATWDGPRHLEDQVLEAVKDPVVRSIEGSHLNVLAVRNQIPLFPHG